MTGPETREQASRPGTAPGSGAATGEPTGSGPSGEPTGGGHSGESTGGPDAGVIVRHLLALLGNLTAITALLIYFGWQRSETQARRLGIDESILGMSTQDYVLRSVGPVLRLLLTVSVAGLLWLWADRAIFRYGAGPTGRARLRWLVRGLGFAWLVFPLGVILVGYLPGWGRLAFLAYPLAIAAGILLTLYAGYLRRTLLDPYDEIPDTPRHESLVRGFAAVLVGTCLFWSASNYATVLGNDLADEFAADIDNAVQVVVYSPKRLHLTAPGVTEQMLPGDESAYRFRYRGLRLLDHTGGNYFLISDGWTGRDGVVVVLPDDTKLRLEFVRGNPVRTSPG